MDAIPQTLLFIGIVPALVLLYISLKGYEGIYKERTIYVMFIIGIVAGVISIILEYSTLQVGFLAIILFPLIEQMFKTIILNLRRYQEKRSTPIYGLSLGVGFGSVFTPYYIIITAMNTSENISLYFALIASVAIIILHGATGILIGFGVYKTELIKYFIIATLLYLPITLTSTIQYASIAVLLYSIIVYWYVTTKILPGIKSKSRKRSKKSE